MERIRFRSWDRLRPTGRSAAAALAVAMLGTVFVGSSNGGGAPAGAASSCSAPQTTKAALAAVSKAPSPKTPAKKLHTYSVGDTPIGVLHKDRAAWTLVLKYVPGFKTLAGWELQAIQSDTFTTIEGYAPSTFRPTAMAHLNNALGKLKPKVPYSEPTTTTEQADVVPYTLPNPLELTNCKPVRNAATWWKERRPQIYTLYQKLVYGVAPGRPADEHFEVTESGGSAFDGMAITKQVVIYLSNSPGAPTIQLDEWLPAQAKGQSPMFLMLDPVSPSQMFPVSPTATEALEGVGTAANAEAFLKAGIGIAGYDYEDVDPDSATGYDQGIRGFDANEAPESQRAPDAWGSIAAWAWSMSRVEDYFQTDPGVNAKRVAVFGISRLGKAALWAAASDRRFAAVIASSSGKLGAALMRRNFGGTIASPDYWVAKNLTPFFNHVNLLPVDTNMLLALIAPRPLLLQTGKLDYGSDPKGEFLAAKAATQVYHLLGAQGLATAKWPSSKPVLSNVGYTMANGGHGPAPSSWAVYVRFLQLRLLTKKG